MSHPVIRVENLGKEYIIGGREKGNETFREMLTNSLAAPFRRLRRLKGAVEEEERFWALKDVSFEVQRGEVVGIIGRNGAGKSTLLKILSRITEPTEGEVEIRGRVASLLEVGTGFHPELTGRENIYLNGAILGMSRAEIDRKFDEIVVFAEVEKFLNTPVKRYSSGMYVRLAFAVAAHIDPEVLIVDEVLAVGDRQFQEKCLGRMQSISKKEGKTILFVSHNLDAVQRICSSAIYLRDGQIKLKGDVEFVIDKYTDKAQELKRSADFSYLKERWGSGRIKIVGMEINDHNKIPVNVLKAGEDYQFIISYEMQACLQEQFNVVASLAISDSRGMTVLLVSSDFEDKYLILQESTGEIYCLIRDFNLAPGNYTLTIFLGRIEGEVFDCLNNVSQIIVAGGNYFGTGHPGLPDHCKILKRSFWRV